VVHYKSTQFVRSMKKYANAPLPGFFER